MPLPNQWRYGLARLKRLNRLLLWWSGLSLVMLAVVISEYWRHPEWLDQFEISEDSPGQPQGGTTLTPEEQAGIADIDNLSTLFDEFGVNPAPPLEGAVASPDQAMPPEASLLALLEEAETPAEVDLPRPSTGEPDESPFAAYLEKYQFLGRSGASPQPAQPPRNDLFRANGLPAPNLPSDAASSGTGATSNGLTGVPWVSPLQQALMQQGQPTRPIPDSAEDPEDPASDPSASPFDFSDLGSRPDWIQEGTLPGSDRTFIRTTPQMSPAPGTTGYTQPPTLNQIAPLYPAGNAYTNALPAPAVVTPDLSPVRPSQASPLPGSSGASALPPTGINTYRQPTTSVPEPAPFTVPRPPGSYTGGGFIDTFSNPSGPVD